MASALAAFAGLAVLWLALSGHTSGLLLGLGALSSAFVVWLTRRMQVAEGDRVLESVRPVALVTYAVWMVGEIVKANLDVSRRILSRGPDIDPVLIKVPATQVSGVGRVIHANSITLTPGTLSVELSDDEISVHALSSAAARELEGGEIGRHVSAIERGASV